ncbi:MAG: hypothetical protein K8R69_04905 [Deltaproteobacteria bacterium]|nr:hypothetical protein [Deltaproteobacteria bacterium]
MARAWCPATPSDCQASGDDSSTINDASEGSYLPFCAQEKNYLTGAKACSDKLLTCTTTVSACVQSICGKATVQNYGSAPYPEKTYLMSYCGSKAALQKAITQCGVNFSKAEIEGSCRPGCGNNILEAGEYCDGSDNPHGGTCASDCQSACGDGTFTTGREECDPSTSVNDCDEQCHAKPQQIPGQPDLSYLFPDKKPVCGDGALQITEECDHGALNEKSGDTCNKQCQFVPSVPVEYACFKGADEACKQSHCSKTPNGNLLCDKSLDACLAEAQGKCPLSTVSLGQAPKEQDPSKADGSKSGNDASGTDGKVQSSGKSEGASTGCSLTRDVTEASLFGGFPAFALFFLAALGLRRKNRKDP